MWEIIQSWPWYDRMIAGAILSMLAVGPWLIAAKLDEIIRLLKERL
jgi:hypothetical protein